MTAGGRNRWRAAAAAVFACGWGGNQFTPLLVMYRETGLSVLVVNALLGAYVIGLVPGLLSAGSLSQRHGRKPVVIAGTALSLTASVLLTLPGVGWIALGRFTTGLGVAVAMAVGSTWVTELSIREGASAETGTKRGALWLTLGFGLGAGVAGALAQWAPAPMVLPYLVHVVLAAVALMAIAGLPETCDVAARTSEHTAHGRFADVCHPRFLRVVLPMAPWIFGSAGLAYAVLPQLVEDRLGSWGLAYSTLLTVCTLGTGALIQPLAKRLDRRHSARGILASMVVMLVGLSASVITALVRSPPVALLAAITLGLAYGIAILSGLLELQRLARPENLAALTGVYYALAYAGFLLPSILALLSGIANYPVLLCSLLMVALMGTIFIAKHSREHLPSAKLEQPAPGTRPALPGSAHHGSL